MSRNGKPRSLPHLATQELMPNLEADADLLSSTDMFLADGKLVLEQPTRLLLWDTNSGDFGIIIPRPSIIGGQDRDHFKIVLC